MTRRILKGRVRPIAMSLFPLLAVATLGCGGGDRRPQAALPMEDAVAIVNANISRIGGTLRATGPVDGSFRTDRGRKRSFHVDGTLFIHAPTYLRFDLKKFNDRQFLVGANASAFWFYSKDDERYDCSAHNSAAARDLPLPADQIISAFGFTPIPTGLGEARTAQRVTDDYQILRVQGVAGGGASDREYWLDRAAPRLLRRVYLRDGSGQVIMESRLDQYRQLDNGGPMMPRTLQARWPQSGSELRFRVNRWTPEPGITPASVQFATPDECG